METPNAPNNQPEKPINLDTLTIEEFIALSDEEIVALLDEVTSRSEEEARVNESRDKDNRETRFNTMYLYGFAVNNFSSDLNNIRLQAREDNAHIAKEFEEKFRELRSEKDPMKFIKDYRALVSEYNMKSLGIVRDEKAEEERRQGEIDYLISLVRENLAANTDPDTLTEEDVSIAIQRIQGEVRKTLMQDATAGINMFTRKPDEFLDRVKKTLKEEESE